jgi:hypothetical protein
MQQQAAVQPHEVPNICLGKFGERHTVRVFFPHFVGDPNASGKNHLSKEQQDQFYNLGIRPAALEVCPEAASDWPADRNSEMFRAKNHGPGFAWGTKLIGAADVESFGEALRDHCQLSGRDWMEDIVFQIQVRGLKMATGHDPTAAEAQRALDDFISFVNPDVPGQVWVDVGLEISVLNRACLWLTDAHQSMVQSALEVTEAQARTLTTPGRRRYQRDVTAHLPALSGCRIPLDAVGPFEASYTQFYSSEKNPTYHPENGHHAKFMTTKMAMRGTPPTILTQLHQVYGTAANELPVSARAEVRVPLAHAHRVLLDWNRETVQGYLAVKPQEEWW